MAINGFWMFRSANIEGMYHTSRGSGWGNGARPFQSITCAYSNQSDGDSRRVGAFSDHESKLPTITRTNL
jgi:hypothetical protein